MRLKEVPATAVMRAIREFDNLGRDDFLHRYGFGPARDYFILLDGRLYDSKAILGAAHGFAFGEPLESGQFSGGLAATVSILQSLGFTVVKDEYQRAPLPPAQPLARRRDKQPTTAPPAPQVPPAGSSVAVAADVVLISCVKTKLPHPAPARDLYTSDYFVSMRRYAEASRLPWFILSAEHGLIAPDDVLAPYDCYLPSMGRGYQREWGYRVARQLEEAVGSLKGKVFDLHASSTYSTAVRRGLEGSGATIVDQLRGLTMGHRLSWYKNPNQSQTQPAAPIDLAPLKDGAHALTLQEWLDSQRNEPREAGLYSWWVNKPGAEELTLGLGHVVRQGLLYAGSAGATRASGTRSTNTLWGRIGTMHLGSKQQFSTLRRSLMGILSSARGHSVSESELTEWMHDHLRLVTVAVADRDSVDALERELLRELDPPLNLKNVPMNHLRSRLRELRSSVG